MSQASPIELSASSICNRSAIALFKKTALAIAMATVSNAALAVEPEERGLTVSVADNVAYDDNLYRLPDSVTNFETTVGPGTSRDDFINTARVAAQLIGGVAQQQFILKGRLDDNRYRENDMLNHRAGNALGEFDWRLGTRWSGVVGAEYDRRLAGFANTQFLQRNVLDRTDYFGTAKFEIGPRWNTEYGLRYSKVDNSATAQKAQNTEVRSWTVGLNYVTPALISWGVDYRGATTRFPEQVALTPDQDREYDDNSVGLLGTYPLSAKTLVKGRAGYTRRNYLANDIGDFSGAVGEALVRWTPGVKTQVELSVYRKLKAFLEADTEYFVSNGAELEVNWRPLKRVAVLARYVHEKNDYRGSFSSSANSRKDTVSTTGLAISYTPIDALTLTLGWNFEDRDSNRAINDYRDNLVSAGIAFAF